VKNYYQLLGIPRSSHILEIRKAYREKALLFHPDKNDSPKAAQEFTEVNEAYSVLKHASSKAKYDRLYDHEILQKSSVNESKYNRRESGRKDTVNHRAIRGRARAKSHSKLKSEQFKKKTKRSSFFDGFSVIIEFLGYLIEIFTVA
jgi:curved DNA-binding protein CbpA